MTLRLNAETFQQMLKQCADTRIGGKLHSVHNVLHASVPAGVGELCEIFLAQPSEDIPLKSVPRLLGEVVGSTSTDSQIMTYRHPLGVRPGMDVIATGRHLKVPVGSSLLGRSVNGLGQPIDQGPPINAYRSRTVSTKTPDALTRRAIHEPLVTGQRVIDGMLTLGHGQRVGLFAGSGVGKSTLMGEIARTASADMNVIVLVGERGREVRPFIDECLGPEGRQRSVVVVATSDETPLMRIQAVKTGIEIASDFREQGANVLFFLDSITRLAHAQRELGLSRGETPGQRGYPPSVHNLLANTLERLGTSDRGSITGIITVLVDGDDMDEPIADAARSILDGHIVLSRSLAARGHYPAIDVLHSVSRLFTDVTDQNHQNAVLQVRQHLAAYEDVREMVQAGLYQPGTIPAVDQALSLMPEINAFLRQRQNECSQWKQTINSLNTLTQARN